MGVIDIIKRFSYTNLTHWPGRPHTFIAIHYTAGVTSKRGAARSAADWFANPNAQGSADFIVDDVETVQFNPDLDNYYCWAVGGSRYNTKGGRLYGTAFNCNTISIEICSINDTGRMTQANDGHYSFSDAALDRAEELTKYLMQKYNIDADHVIRHYDVNGKPCPGIYGWNADTGDESAWRAFHARLTKSTKEDEEMTYEQFVEYQKRYEADLAKKAPSSWAADTAKRAILSGLFNDGDGDGILDNPQAPLTREQFVAVLDRAGILSAQDRFIARFEDLPDWAKDFMREILDTEVINGGTDKDIDSEDINMYLSDIKVLAALKRIMRGEQEG